MMTDKPTRRTDTPARIAVRSRDPRIAVRSPRRPGLAEWLRLRLSRYGSCALEAWPAAFVFVNGALRPGPTHVVVRQSHLSVAQAWAPRMEFIVVSGAPPAASQLSAPAAGGQQAGSPTPLRLRKQPAPPKYAPPAPMVTRTVAGAPALLTASRMEQRSSPVDSVQPLQPVLGSARSSGARDDRAPVVVPAAPVARVVHRSRALPEAHDPGGPAPAAPPGELPVARQRRPETAPAPVALDADPVAIDRITDRVMQQIGHRIQAHRERMGRV